MRVAQSVVLITGASEGIGAACVREFQARGARVVLTARNEAKLRALARPEDLVVAGDITAPETRQAVADQAMARYGRIDILVNNAGVGLYKAAWKAPLDDVRAMYELNVFSLLGMVQAVAPVMKNQGRGVIVNVSSIAGRVPLAWFTAYCGSKFAVSSMTAGLRMELRQYGIHVMDVCPGYVKTGFQEHALSGNPPDRLWRMRKFKITAEECASALVRGVEREKRSVVVPWMGNLLIAGRALMPGLIERAMEHIYKGLDLDKEQ
jgi:short-subunit dehydrogenase